MLKTKPEELIQKIIDKKHFKPKELLTILRIKKKILLN